MLRAKQAAAILTLLADPPNAAAIVIRNEQAAAQRYGQADRSADNDRRVCDRPGHLSAWAWPAPAVNSDKSSLFRWSSCPAGHLVGH